MNSGVGSFSCFYFTSLGCFSDGLGRTRTVNNKPEKPNQRSEHPTHVQAVARAKGGAGTTGPLILELRVQQEGSDFANWREMMGVLNVYFLHCRQHMSLGPEAKETRAKKSSRSELESSTWWCCPFPEQRPWVSPPQRRVFVLQHLQGCPFLSQRHILKFGPIGVSEIQLKSPPLRPVEPVCLFKTC